MPESDGAITINNRPYPGHLYRAEVDEVFRMALRGLPGGWDVSACPVGWRWFRIDNDSQGGGIARDLSPSGLEGTLK